MRYKISSPNTAYNDHTGGIPFANGVAHVDEIDELVRAYMVQAGYTIEEAEAIAEAVTETVEEIAEVLQESEGQGDGEGEGDASQSESEGDSSDPPIAKAAAKRAAASKETTA